MVIRSSGFVSRGGLIEKFGFSSQNAGMSSDMYANKKTVLPGFVSGGSIGGGIHTAQTSSSANSTPVYSGTSLQSRENASQKNSEG